MHERAHRQKPDQAGTPTQRSHGHARRGAGSAHSAAWTQALGSRPVFMPQAKLTVNAPGDRFEREADCVAEQIMQMPEPGLQRKPG
jgi:hypothetical protein